MTRKQYEKIVDELSHMLCDTYSDDWVSGRKFYMMLARKFAEKHLLRFVGKP